MRDTAGKSRIKSIKSCLGNMILCTVLLYCFREMRTYKVDLGDKKDETSKNRGCCRTGSVP